MQEHRIRRVPVIDDHRPVGMIGEADLAGTWTSRGWGSSSRPSVPDTTGTRPLPAGRAAAPRWEREVRGPDPTVSRHANRATGSGLRRIDSRRCPPPQEDRPTGFVRWPPSAAGARLGHEGLSGGTP
ncbi:CBS domain-containing protein [Streptomyces sp. NRRL B-24572]|uniref:CBS domain-containing protein n=1 Tax=Streptomyces sp. NRRL B-24572 TaxID=1962156 RepID=UPI00277D0ADA|nr:hypothetical protein [Streptomyces sp. NRRL B-24572]